MSQEPIKGQEQDVIFDENGSPFQTEKAAKLRGNALGLDAALYGVLPQDGGYALVRKASGIWQAEQATTVRTPTKGKGADANKEPEYFRVRFHAKASPSDTRDVELSVNCEPLIMQRERPVVLPKRYLLLAKDARYPQYTQVPGQPRKIVGWIQTYPFDVLGAATEEEFIRERTMGTQATREPFVNDESAPKMAAV